jgi:hypothetical protein
VAKVHRAYRHSWWRKSKEITDRDWQAMCNFADEGVPLKVLAEHFRCELALIEHELVDTDHYGYRRKTSNNAGDYGAGGDAIFTFREVMRRLSQSTQREYEPDWDEISDAVNWHDYYRAVEQWEKRKKPREPKPEPTDFLPERMRERLSTRYAL